MKNIFFIIGLLSALSLGSCNKDYTEFYSDNRPDIPVTFPGATTYGFNPYKTVSLADGDVEFTLSIPENSGRTIRQITKVVGGGTAVNAGSIRDTTSSYIATPIVGNGTNVTFTTTLDEFASKSTANAGLVRAGGELAFMFLLVLDNDQEIIPVQTRVRITE